MRKVQKQKKVRRAFTQAQLQVRVPVEQLCTFNANSLSFATVTINEQKSVDKNKFYCTTYCRHAYINCKPSEKDLY